jgi:hypothetical protein
MIPPSISDDIVYGVKYCSGVSASTHLQKHLAVGLQAGS